MMAKQGDDDNRGVVMSEKHNGTSEFHQGRYWKELTQLRAQIEYLNLQGARSDQFDNRISIILAITSNGSIAAWAVWSKFPLVWGGFIALSQLINAIRPYLPYQKQKKAIESLVPGLEGLFLRAESDWFQVAEGGLISSQINDLITKLKQQKLEMTQKHLLGIPLEDDNVLIEEAKEKARVYFRATFGV